MINEPPPGVRGTKTVWMIINVPPPKPLCFDTVDDWQRYLCGVAESGQKVTRRQDTGRYNGKRTVRIVFDRVDYCEDCAIGGSHQMQMMADRRCILPPGYVQKKQE